MYSTVRRSRGGSLEWQWCCTAHSFMTCRACGRVSAAVGCGLDAVMSADETQQAFLSRLLLMLGIFVVMCLLMF